MSAPECPREQDVINAIVTGRWPDRCDESLCMHAAECAVCKELIEVTSVMRLDRDGLHEEMSLPSAGQVGGVPPSAPGSRHRSAPRNRSRGSSVYRWPVPRDSRLLLSSSCGRPCGSHGAARVWARGSGSGNSFDCFRR